MYTAIQAQYVSLGICFCFDFWVLDVAVCTGPDSRRYHHSGLIAFVLQWSHCNKQLAFCNIADACAFVYIDES